jgi:hypothetical protein
MLRVVPERAIRVRALALMEDVRPVASGTETPAEAVSNPVTPSVPE